MAGPSPARPELLICPDLGDPALQVLHAAKQHGAVGVWLVREPQAFHSHSGSGRVLGQQG